jgi:hypothetical protein
MNPMGTISFTKVRAKNIVLTDPNEWYLYDDDIEIMNDDFYKPIIIL